jgi:uncharacterized membrane protein AbrB (regulator of aidB expression)
VLEHLVVLGTTVTASTLPELGALWLPVAVVTLGTLLSAVALGLLLSRACGLDAGTAVLACVPGGAVGLVVMSREMGADDRLVAFSQYLRVLVILVATPFLAASLFAGHEVVVASGAPVPNGAGAAGVAVALGAGGWLLGRTIRLPAPSLLGPMLVAAAVTMLLPTVPAHVPAPILEAAFALVGLDVGLRFTGDVLRQLRRLIPMMALCIALLLGLVPARAPADGDGARVSP